MQSFDLNRKLRAAAILFGLTALGLCARIPAVTAQDVTPKWQKLCQELPDTNCATWIEIATGTDNELIGLQIFEPKHDAPEKFLRAFVRFKQAPVSPAGSIKIALDSKPFAELPFVQCQDKLCFGQRQLTESEIGVLERTKVIQAQSAHVSVTVPADTIAQARISRGTTPAEASAELQRVLAERRKQSEAQNRKDEEERLKLEASRDPDKENCGSISLGYVEGIAACDRAIKSGKYKGRELADLYHTRGLSHGSNGHPDLGTADFNAAIRADPTFAPAYAERGDDYLHARQFDLAIKDFNEALRLGGDDFNIIFSRGLAYRLKGDKARAIADFRRVLQLNPRIDVARDELRELGANP